MWITKVREEHLRQVQSPQGGAVANMCEEQRGGGGGRAVEQSE